MVSIETLPGLNLVPKSNSLRYECVSYPNTSIHLTRSRIEHDKRRKIWDRGFSTKCSSSSILYSCFACLLGNSALREYEHRVTGFTDQLISQLNAHSGEPMNASRWMNYYAFDMMGDMAFGKSFDMLKTGEKVCFIEANS
jgi:cytochrome P450 family 628